eukprot:SAG31_NODE_18561_length_631_cov_1.716165_1_plen_157_part_10
MNGGNLIGGWLAFVLSTACASIAVALSQHFDKDQLALALTYCFMIPLFAAFVGQVSNMTAMFYQSLDRLLEYTQLPQEGSRYSNEDGKLDSIDWPTKGTIEFVKASLRYKPDLPLALRDVSLVLPGGQHVGVVGRTGAGKSSLLALLFRLVEPAGGQ